MEKWKCLVLIIFAFILGLALPWYLGMFLWGMIFILLLFFESLKNLVKGLTEEDKSEQ